MPSLTEQAVPYLSRDEIEQRAAEVLRHHGLETIPIDPVTLANRSGIAVHNAKFADDKLSGMIAKRGDNVTLLVNASDPPYRKRFTISHELGHHFLHLMEDGEFIDGEANLFRSSAESQVEITADRRAEIQANMFAAALLMPEAQVRQLWPEIQSLEQSARLFNVSTAAMGNRLNQLGIL